ncbi:protein NCBP2AS2 homolog [Argiope bruennichi]|uniref:Protein NCBP2AS2 like protein n=1 Tax=Argiope bruennichi TaxID=94029 RepID=A0A8T0FJ47_ARGBR|nr:protein NCBP2AS2 homolog [Argiope bruennichi]XP_055929215.1 protein NCBP2AS2 homolog [Argiope bruennichi]XP_055929216.1 protein NCBP2AS2 homolog [Argiope bruennichi]XP_055929217.1 protein NCBP2AS2 homolog [Argiope bruennichi]KAF8791031.1 Protein NCBP2AS2 like protein [Argiope bruennichi]
MVLRLLIRYLANNEKLIQMLADSYPIRKAARFAAGLIIRSKIYQERALESLRKAKDSSNITDSHQSGTSGSFSQFMQDKVEKLKKILEEQKRQG